MDALYHYHQCERCQTQRLLNVVTEAMWRARHDPIEESATEIYARALYGAAA